MTWYTEKILWGASKKPGSLYHLQKVWVPTLTYIRHYDMRCCQYHPLWTQKMFKKVQKNPLSLINFSGTVSEKKRFLFLAYFEKNNLKIFIYCCRRKTWNLFLLNNSSYSVSKSGILAPPKWLFWGAYSCTFCQYF